MSDHFAAIKRQLMEPALDSIIKKIDELDALRAELVALLESMGVKDHLVTYRIKTPLAPAEKSLPPKYRDPVSGKTWVGRGKHPRWFQEDDPRLINPDWRRESQLFPPEPSAAEATAAVEVAVEAEAEAEIV